MPPCCQWLHERDITAHPDALDSLFMLHYKAPPSPHLLALPYYVCMISIEKKKGKRKRKKMLHSAKWTMWTSGMKHVTHSTSVLRKQPDPRASAQSCYLPSEVYFAFSHRGLFTWTKVLIRDNALPYISTWFSPQRWTWNCRSLFSASARNYQVL